MTRVITPNSEPDTERGIASRRLQFDARAVTRKLDH
jgi:hypothetical protein